MKKKLLVILITAVKEALTELIAYLDTVVVNLNKVKRVYGHVKDDYDERDLKFVADPAISLPQSVDLRPQCSPVEDQGQLGACTSFGTIGALEFLELKDGKPLNILSHLFEYYNSRLLEGTTNQDSGAQIRDAIKAAKMYGICTEKTLPYIIKNFKKKPSTACYTEATKYELITYKTVNQTLNDMQSCLASGYPIIIGMSVYESFESQEVAQTGIVPMPKNNEQLLGGHCVLVVGYDNASQRFIVKNSWNTTWGIQGYFTIPYAYLTNRKLASDFWMISKSGNV